MRVTNRMVVDNALRRITQRQEQLDTSRDRLSSGRRITRISQDPTGASRVLTLRADQRAHDQYRRNAEDAQTLLRSTDDALQSLSERLRRARDLAVSGANSKDGTAHRAIAQEIAALREELRAIGNQEVAGRPLFSGFAAGPPFVLDPATGAVTYAGDDGAVERRIGDHDTVRANADGRAAFGFAAGRDVFSVLSDLEASLRAGDVDAVSAGIGEIDTAMARVGDATVAVGAADGRVTSALERIDQAMATLRGEISVVEDVSMTDAIMELQLQEMAYQATLAATSRALPPSLVDFLR